MHGRRIAHRFGSGYVPPPSPRADETTPPVTSASPKHRSSSKHMNRLGNAMTSSIGKKVIMGLTGLLLVGFLVEHLHGNLKLLEDPSGQAFDDYVAYLQGFGPLLTVAEVGLALLFLAHIYVALRLTHENFLARDRRYVVRKSRVATFGSVSMFYTGALLLGYLIKHLLDFRFDAEFFDEPHARVREVLSRPGSGMVYLVAALVLGVHLSHGFRSALQSLGANHPSWNRSLEILGKVIALVFAVGFAAFPVYFYFTR